MLNDKNLIDYYFKYDHVFSHYYNLQPFIKFNNFSSSDFFGLELDASLANLANAEKNYLNV